MLASTLAGCSPPDEGARVSGSGEGSGTTGVASGEGDELRLDVGAGSFAPTTGDVAETGASEGGGSSGGPLDGGETEGDELDRTACLPTLVFAGLDEHMHELARSAEMMTNHPSARQPLGFLLAPGLPMPPATPVRFANVPDLPCTAARLYPPVCDGVHCYQVECTGDGATWMTLLWNESAVEDRGWRTEHVYVLTSWNEHEPGLEFAMTTQSVTATGHDVSLLAKGRMIANGFYIVEQFDDLHELGEVRLAYVWENDVFAGSLRIRDFTVARVDAGGHLEPTGVCPPKAPP